MFVPELVPDRLEPVIVPADEILRGVMAPRPITIVPEPVIGEPDTETPLFPAAATDVTVPTPPEENGISVPAELSE